MSIELVIQYDDIATENLILTSHVSAEWRGVGFTRVSRDVYRRFLERQDLRARNFLSPSNFKKRNFSANLASLLDQIRNDTL